MRELPEAFAARLGEATTICLCWRLTLADGTRMGFTDHDGDLSLDGVTYLAGSGLRGGEIEQKLGLRVSTAQIAGALRGVAFDAEAIAAGRLDGASVVTMAVDWTSPTSAVELDRSEIGTVTRRDGVYVAELRSPAQHLEAPTGRLFQASCDAELGDARCGVTLSPLTQPATVTGFDGQLFVTVVATGRVAGWFTDGLLVADGQRLRIRDHRVSAAGDDGLALWTVARTGLHPGMAVTLVAGCDKSHAMCRDRFANVANFRGYPHMPGNDLVLAYVRADDVAMDGGSLFR